MTLYDWIYSNYPPNSKIGGQWGGLHIFTIILCVTLIVGLAILGKRKKEWRKTIIYTLVIILAVFEVTRRIINLTRGDSLSFHDVLHLLLPRPWCAICCFCIFLAVIFKRQYLYNFVSINALLCSLVFFAYPSVGFNNRYILFENVYSISTHSLLLIISILLICYGITDFRYKRGESWRERYIWEGISLAAVFVYAFVEIFVLKIEKDPLYFMEGNDVQKVLGCSYPVYLIIYMLFLVFYFNAFYLVQWGITQRKKKQEAETIAPEKETE